jgi:Leucine-rich repeat (LRR) protein
MGLRSLSIFDSPIEKLPDSIERLKNLENLSIAGCNLIDFPIKMGNFKNNKN